MERSPAVTTVRTARLELLPLTRGFVDALVAGDHAAAGADLDVEVGEWLANDSSHVVQLHLAQQAGEAEGFPGLGRAIVLLAERRPLQVIGSIGFHGPPDHHGRLELGCRIDPAHRGRGYAAEAMTALVDWATAGYGITGFLVAIPSRRDTGDLVPLEIVNRPGWPADERIDGLASILELANENRGGARM